MKKIVIIVVTIVSAMTYITGCGSDPLDPEAYRKLSEKKWEKIYKATSPDWSIKKKASEDVKEFEKLGATERRRRYKELQEEVED